MGDLATNDLVRLFETLRTAVAALQSQMGVGPRRDLGSFRLTVRNGLPEPNTTIATVTLAVSGAGVYESYAETAAEALRDIMRRLTAELQMSRPIDESPFEALTELMDNLAQIGSPMTIWETAPENGRHKGPLFMVVINFLRYPAVLLTFDFVKPEYAGHLSTALFSATGDTAAGALEAAIAQARERLQP